MNTENITRVRRLDLNTVLYSGSAYQSQGSSAAGHWININIQVMGLNFRIMAIKTTDFQFNFFLNFKNNNVKRFHKSININICRSIPLQKAAL